MEGNSQNFWHTKNVQEIFKELNSSDQGISKKESHERLKKYGANKLPESKSDSILVIFVRQFKSPLIYILIIASILTLIVGEVFDSIIIFVVLIFNAIVGAVQEGKAQNTLQALKSFTETSATLLRDGKELIVQDYEVVKGDIIFLQEGEKVPADLRIISSRNLRVNESALTGESEPVIKNSEQLFSENLSIVDQKNMVFKGTFVVAGNATAIVVATGTQTVIGQISKKIALINTEIPLQKSIRNLSNLIIFVVLIICTLLFFGGVLLGKSWYEMFTTIVSFSVSIIPEGLPIVLTLVLATGVWRMSRRNALVKKLQAVEALGQATVIAVDKTGTITKNELMVQNIFVNNSFFEVLGEGYEPKGKINLNGVEINPTNYPELVLAGKIGLYCSNARVMYSEEALSWKIAGDPTEAATVVLAKKLGIKEENPEIYEIPFDYKTKFHASVRENNFLAVVGAPETILTLSKTKFSNGESSVLTNYDRIEFEKVFEQMSSKGMRVVAAAYTENATEPFNEKSVTDLTFIGFLGMKDTLRPEVFKAMERAKHAGIRVVMITGDYKVTAEAIAREAGIFNTGDGILTGTEIDNLSDEQLSEEIRYVSVFARVTPDHKIRIVEAYKKNGEIVAMTGDGVNDAPSLIAADLGVAMGKIGTEVAKEAADIVLLDDNFGSIISAVEEGRSIYKTIKKVILYLFSTNAGEVFTISAALLLGFPLPILPVHIIWLNFVTDGFLDVALAMEPKEKGLLKKRVGKSHQVLVDRRMIFRIVLMGLPMMIGTLLLFQKYYQTDLIKAWTVALTTLAVFQWFNALNCRFEDKSIFFTNPFSNKFLFWALIATIIAQLFAVYNPIAQTLLKTTALSISEWASILLVSTSIIWVEEIRKFIYRRWLKHSEKNTNQPLNIS